MKPFHRLYLLLIADMCIITLFPLSSSAATSEPLRVFVNGYQVQFTQLPIVEDGNTLVQLRPIYESLGLEIDWHEDTQTITSTRNRWEIVMKVDSTEATVNGERSTLAVAPRIIHGTTFVPLRFVGESVDGDVTWDEKTNHVDIIYDKSYYVFLAASKNDMDKVQYWLGHEGGANFASKNDGLTTLSWALDHKNIEMLELLLKYGADPNHSLVGFGDFLRPLESAVLGKNLTEVQLLIDYGADATHRGKEGSALDLAKKYLQKETQASNQEKLMQIIEILDIAIKKDALALSDERVLIPFNDGAKINIMTSEMGSWGYLDNTGTVAIKPKFAPAFPFSEGLAFAASKDGRLAGYIDKTGKFQFIFDFIPSLYPKEFKEGLAPVGKDKKWGFIDKTGAFAITPVYDDALPFSEGLAAVEQGGKWGLVNHSGDVVVEPTYSWIFTFHEGLALVRGETSGFINSKGELVIDFNKLGISEYGQYADGLAPVFKNGKIGFINMKGEFVISPTFEKAVEFSEASAAVSIEGKYGYINSLGQFIVTPQFDYAFSFRNGQAFVKQNGKWGVINSKGELIVPLTFTGIDDIMESFWGTQYSAFSEKANGMAILYKDDEVYYVLPDGKIVKYIKPA